MRPHVLVVAPTHDLAITLVAWLSAADYELTVTTDFVTARTRLQAEPDLIVTEVKLGAYNGLHLAVRAPGTSVVVLGESDPVLQMEAQHVGATYLTVPVTQECLMPVVSELLARRTKTVAT